MKCRRNAHQICWVTFSVLALSLFFWLALVSSTPSRGAASSANWRSGGPFAPDTATMTPTVVLDVEASPYYAGDHTLFAATQSGLFRSVNSGDSWQLVLPLAQNGEHNKFSHVRLSPAYATDGVVIAAYADAPAATSTLFQSIDHGDTWQTLATFTETVTALAISPNFNLDHTLFAIMGDGTALHKSTDGGQHWQQARFGPEDYFNGFELAVSPNYAQDQTLFATGFGTVHRSIDGGMTWSALNTNGVTYGLAVSPAFASDRTVWASYRAIEGPGDGTPESSVMRSFDGGATWVRTATGLPGVYEPFARVIAVTPYGAHNDALFTALSGQLLGVPSHSLFRSYDRGASWVDLGMPPANPDIHDVAVTDTDAEGIVAHVATAQGVWHFHTPCEQRIVNAGFEYDSGWNFPITAYSAGTSTEVQHSGARSARMGIRSLSDNKYSYSSVQQTVIIPSDAVSVTLTLWWNGFTGEQPLPATAMDDSSQVQAVAVGAQLDTALAGDRQYVLLLNEQGAVLEQLLWTRRNLAEWQPLTFDLSKYAGETVRVHFGVYNDGVGGVTSMFVDDVALTTCPTATPVECWHFFPLLCSPAEPTVTSTPTSTSTPTPTLTPTATLAPTATPTQTVVPTPAQLWPDPPAAIEVFSPLAHERYRSPIDVNGFGRTFEGNVYLRLLDAHGNLIGQHRARAGMTSFDFFHGYLRFEVTEEMTATLKIYEAAAPDQPPISSVVIPITVEPGQRFVDLNAPAPGSTVCGRVPVQGYSNTFEATVVVELTGRDGTMLEQTSTMGGNLGLYAEFATYFDYDVTTPREALVGAQEISPRDGVPIDHVRVPVSLYPAGHDACQ